MNSAKGPKYVRNDDVARRDFALGSASEISTSRVRCAINC